MVIKLFYGTFLLRICQKNRQQNGKKKVFNKSDKMQKNCGKCIKKYKNVAIDVKNAQKIHEKLAKRLKRPKMVRIPLKTFPKSASIKPWETFPKRS